MFSDYFENSHPDHKIYILDSRIFATFTAMHSFVVSLKFESPGVRIMILMSNKFFNKKIYAESSVIHIDSDLKIWFETCRSILGKKTNASDVFKCLDDVTMIRGLTNQQNKVAIMVSQNIPVSIIAKKLRINTKTVYSHTNLLMNSYSQTNINRLYHFLYRLYK